MCSADGIKHCIDAVSSESTNRLYKVLGLIVDRNASKIFYSISSSSRTSPEHVMASDATKLEERGSNTKILNL